jgi:magnesium transporter
VDADSPRAAAEPSRGGYVMTTVDILTRAELQEAWPALSPEERLEGFRLLIRTHQGELFAALGPRDQLELLEATDPGDRRAWVSRLPPDDAVDLIQESSDDAQRAMLLEALDEPTRRQVTALRAYAEDAAGGLMNPRYYRLRPDMTVDEAIAYLRQQIAEPSEPVHYAYVLDGQQRLLGVVPFRDLIRAKPRRLVTEIMNPQVITLPEDMDQEEVGRRFAQNDLLVLPVVDAEGRMKGIVTADDVLDVVHEEATEDIHKAGGMGVLTEPYLQIGIPTLIRKRVGWLAALFIGETFTATAMAFFEQELARAIVLSLFIPLIVSSGGNAGSQASTLIIRAMALGHVRLRDWFHVFRREVLTGLSLGCVLASIGLIRIFAWEAVYQKMKHVPLYGEHYVLVALTVSFSLVGVVLWGSVAGCMLPFLLRAMRFDPASASAPFVATLVDVTGLVIYLSIANILLQGTLL